MPSAGGLGDAFADEDDVIAPGDRIGVVTESKGPKLRFCPESNDILYPREDKQRRVLIYACKSCSYEVNWTPASIRIALSVPEHSDWRFATMFSSCAYTYAGGCRPTEQRVWRLVCVQK